MGLFSRFRTELIDIIEWVDDDRHTLVWRFPRYRNQIKNGAQLIVRPGQMAVFVREGEIADVFAEGHYTLETQNLPILSTLAGWKYGFDSPFMAEVYFVSTRQITELKWGTPNPVMMRDADFGPIRLRAFGTYALRAADPKILIRELVGTDGNVDADEIRELLRSIIISAFTDMIGSAGIPALDLASHYRDLSEQLRAEVCQRIDDEYGLEIPFLAIVNISLPEEVEQAIDARSSMSAIGNLQAYQHYQMGRSIPDAAKNPAGGIAGAGMGLGLGVAMANQFQPGFGQTQTPPPPPPPVALWHLAENGATTGPFTLHQLVDSIRGGRLTKQTLVWTSTLPGWTAAGEVGDLAAYFNQATPPPPPPVG